MSGYQARRGPNMNQYIANLNAVPSPQENVPAQEYGNLEEELALFTNTEFINEFDLGDNEHLGDGKNVGFDDGFRLNEFYVPPTSDPALATIHGFPAQPQPANGFFPAPPAGGPVPGHHHHPQHSGSTSGATTFVPSTPTISSPAAGSSTQGEKLVASGPHSPSEPLEASSRAVAEEDKRRRNTAASARFRVKKKQREQALEKTAKEMTDRAEKLEMKVAELERENKWLRGLVVEKAGGKEEDVSKLLEKVSEGARKGDSPKKGVGTDSEAKAEMV